MGSGLGGILRILYRVVHFPEALFYLLCGFINGEKEVEDKLVQDIDQYGK